MDDLYYARLAKLKRELSAERKKREKKKKKFTPNQQIMINFINNVTKSAVFEINGKKIILRKGNSFGGFKHILEKHYCSGCNGEITLLDILNMDLTIQRGLLLNNTGVTNKDNIVYSYLKSSLQYKLVLKEEKENQLVVTYYTVDR